MSLWEKVLEVGLLLVGAAKDMALAEGMSDEDFKTKREEIERKRGAAVDAAKAALRALIPGQS
jgi:hypothetical protein